MGVAGWLVWVVEGGDGILGGEGCGGGGYANKGVCGWLATCGRCPIAPKYLVVRVVVGVDTQTWLCVVGWLRVGVARLHRNIWLCVLWWVSTPKHCCVWLVCYVCAVHDGDEISGLACCGGC